MSTSSGDYLGTLFAQDGRTAVVTGASSGLGAEMARVLAGAGADVVAVARRADRLAALADSAAGLSGSITACPADLSRDDGIESVANVVEQRGGCDVLVANAGVAEVGKLESMDDESFSRVVSLNLNAQWRLAKILHPWLAASAAGRIINIASIYGICAPVRAGVGAYTASKHGLVGLTRAEAVEWAASGITVNAIAPGYFPTEMTEALLESKAAERLRQFVPMDRFGAPQELATALLFLASPASSYVTGVVVPVDGGWSAW
ncbi:MAG: SDR family NAD(P)-dependent oxidoreductase [Gammaproteobacteria bacterium]|nr:SDR family NAD(P)-dependent oxidoreductase [Gammaproteobacteria bacterium]